MHTLIAHAVPALNDNYIWIIDNEQDQTAVIVDPGESAPIIEYLRARELMPRAILLTHHHHDHTGGVAGLTAEYDIPVYAHENEVKAAATHRVTDGEIFRPGDFAADFQAIAIPGHTLGHCAYLCGDMLFSGDTLFSAGCGRVFEGTALQMYQSLLKLVALPDDTKVYAGHEYTLANLHFAATVEPNNEEITLRQKKVAHMREQNLPSLPSTLKTEKSTNPFLRCHKPALMQAASIYKNTEIHHASEVFAALREWKNNF